MRVGVVTAAAPDLPLTELDGIQMVVIDSEYSTTFENIYTPEGRIQTLHHQATPLDLTHIPEIWRRAPIVHLGPIAQEVDPRLAGAFPNSLVGLTPQGWLRSWDHKGKVRPSEWPEAAFVLEKASAAVLSIEDVQGDENRVEEMLASMHILVITEGARGSRLYWNGEPAPFQRPQHDGDGRHWSRGYFCGRVLLPPGHRARSLGSCPLCHQPGCLLGYAPWPAGHPDRS